MYSPPPHFASSLARLASPGLGSQGDLCGVVEYPVKALKFQNCLHLVLHFPADEDTESEKQLFWIGLKGMSSNYQRKAVVTVYESQANLADHPNREEEGMDGLNLKQNNLG